MQTTRHPEDRLASRININKPPNRLRDDQADVGYVPFDSKVARASDTPRTGNDEAGFDPQVLQRYGHASKALITPGLRSFTSGELQRNARELAVSNQLDRLAQ